MRYPLTISLIALAACGGNQVGPAPSPPPIAPTASATTTASAVASNTPPASTGAPAADGGAAPPATPSYQVASIALPGASGPVSLDYLAVDRATGKVWVPAGGTGSVDVIDAATKQISHIDGFPTAERTMRNTKRIVGTSSATIGDGVVYVGNRADSSICAIDAHAMTKGACLTLPSSPDGIAYVASVKELWATTPRDSSLTVLDASKPGKLSVKTKITLAGSPEGYAVDEAHGLFFTNLEDKDKTVVIDVKTHKVTSTWEPACGGDGPRGLAIDPAKQVLFVACTDHVETVDTSSGVVKSKLDTGAGVDNIDYVPALGQLFVAAGKDGKLTVATLDAQGGLALYASAPTSPGGTKVVVADAQGDAYVTDGMNGRILMLSPVH